MRYTLEELRDELEEVYNMPTERLVIEYNVNGEEDRQGVIEYLEEEIEEAEEYESRMQDMTGLPDPGFSSWEDFYSYMYS